MLPMKTQGATMPTTMNCRIVPSSISGGNGSPSIARREQARDRVVGRIERLRLAHRDDRAGDVVERDARALDAVHVELLHRVHELARRLADRHPELGGQVEELGEDVAGKAMRELGADVRAALVDERLQEIADDASQLRLDRRHLLDGEVGVERAPVGRVLGRVEVERRAAAGEGEPRHDVLDARREERRIAGRGEHVVVAQERPEAVPGIAVGDRAGLAEHRELLVEAPERLGLERVEVLDGPLGVDGHQSSSSAIARFGQASTASRTAASCSGAGTTS